MSAFWDEADRMTLKKHALAAKSDRLFTARSLTHSMEAAPLWG
jgi:hypothetical protein